MIDDFSKAVQKISELRIPVSTVSQLCGISNAELSALFNYQKVCTNERASKIWRTVQMLDELVRAVAPIPVDFRKAVVLGEILTLIQQGDGPLVLKPDTILSDVPELSILVSLAEQNLQKEKETCQ